MLFHTAAFFRDSYTGGSHWNSLVKVNVEGTANLFETAYNAGIRRFVHTSSVAVLGSSLSKDALVDETMLRDENEACGQELYGRMTKTPVLLSVASVRNMMLERGRCGFSHIKTEQELGASFRPFVDTLRDTISWYREAGWLKQ